MNTHIHSTKDKIEAPLSTRSKSSGALLSAHASSQTIPRRPDTTHRPATQRPDTQRVKFIASRARAALPRSSHARGKPTRAADRARPHGRALGTTMGPRSPCAAALGGREGGAAATVEATAAEPAYQAVSTRANGPRAAECGRWLARAIQPYVSLRPPLRMRFTTPFAARGVRPAGGPDRTQTRRTLRFRSLRAWKESNSQRACRCTRHCI